MQPGDPSKKELLAEIIRVNHAGEYGAKRIYEGQLSVLKNTAAAGEIEHMQEQELVHLAYFEEQMRTRRVRPSLLSPFWHLAGFALGAITARMGEKAAMACTVAVEEAIDEHYSEQIEMLAAEEPELVAKIKQFREEELEHKDIALINNAKEAPFYPILSTTIKAGCKLAIWLAKRI